MGTDPVSFQPQSTDRLPGDTSPDTSRVLLRGHSTITSASQGAGIDYSYGSAIKNLSQYNFSSIIPEASVYVEGTAQDGSTLYLKAPYTDFSSTFVASNLAINYFVGYSIQQGTAKGAGYVLRLVMYVISKSPSVSVVVDWQIKSTPAAGILSGF